MTRDLAHPQRTAASYYDVLQVSPTASQEVIHAAYRALARSCHPDINPTVGAAERMLQLNAAYKVLADSERRAQYDLRQTRVGRSVARPFPTPTAGTIMRGKPRPDSPKRVEDERAARATWSPVRPRVFALVLMILVLTTALAMALWITVAFLDEVPGAAFPGDTLADGLSAVRVRPALEIDLHRVAERSAQPFLNHG
jgi:hypothetical protein